MWASDVRAFFSNYLEVLYFTLPYHHLSYLFSWKAVWNCRRTYADIIILLLLLLLLLNFN